MFDYIAIIWAIVKKDLIEEWRSREIVASVAVFSLIVLVSFQLAVDLTPGLVKAVLPGIFWVTIIFGGLIGMMRAFSIEIETGGLKGMLLTSASRDAIFFGKAISIFFIMALMEILILPLLIVVFNVQIQLIPMFMVSVLSLVGLALIGTVLSAISFNTRAREAILPILFLPIIAPVLIAAVECTKSILLAENMSSYQNWLELIVVFDLIYLVACPYGFSFVISD